MAQRVRDRRNRRMIFEVMARTAPKLMKIPMVGKTYDASLAKRWPKLKIAQNPFSSQATNPQQAQGRNWFTALAIEDANSIKSYILDQTRSSPIFDVIDRGKFETLISSAATIRKGDKIKQIIVTLQATMFMECDWIDKKNDISGFRPGYEALDSNLAVFQQQ